MPSADEALTRSGQTPRAGLQRGVVVVSAAVIAVLLYQLQSSGTRMPVLLIIGVMLGITLYHASFGFTGAYHNLFARKDPRGVQAQLMMVGLATLLFAPLLSQGQFMDRTLGGAVAPVGWQVATGAFAFGVGMQLGGGCGSGTLFAAGGGGLRQAVTLIAFIAGSFWASLHMGWWQQLPSFGAVALGEAWGWGVAALLQVVFLAAVWWGLALWRRDARLTESAGAPDRSCWLKGPWPLLWGAAILALLNAATLVVAGHPWTITWAFSLWGAKAATVAGWDAAGSAFWSGGFPGYALQRGVLEDVTSVMDIGIILGAFMAAALASRWGQGQTLAPARVWVAALLGGLLMGYGARIAFGCNIGAFFSGVASTSLHGWLWIAAALPGNWLGVRLRPYFGLSN